jgi:predicted MFS family arabinose efflux permease
VRGFGPILAGLCATLVGVGLQRFAYAPLLPAMVQAGWLSAGGAGTLGAANFSGYLAGAALAPTIGRWLGMRRALRTAIVVASGCFALCAWRGGLGWFVPWRTLAGIAGGVLMVLAGPAVQGVVAPAARGLAAGVMFAGVGLGIAASATIVPALLPVGLPAAWLVLAAVASVLAVVSWPRWPDVPPPPQVRLPRLRGGPIGRLVAAYALGGVAATPHMGWWPDFIARGLGQGTATGSAYWLLYGVAAASGPALCGRLADRVGVGRAYFVGSVAQAVAVALPLASQGVPALVVSTALAGATTVGLTALALTRALELAGAAAPGIWRLSTVGWAAAQTATGFVLAWLYTATGSHLPMFAVGLAAALFAAVLARP